jgi:Transmembrane secretion effector
VLVARHRRMQLIVAMSAAVTFTSAAFLVVEPLYARHELHRPPSQFALFEAASGIGAILASLVISRFRARPTGRRVTLAALGIRVGALALAGVAILAGLTCLTIAVMHPAPTAGGPAPDGEAS